MEAATDLLASLDSPQALTLRMVARHVGVAPASVYSHFADLGAWSSTSCGFGTMSWPR